MLIGVLLVCGVYYFCRDKTSIFLFLLSYTTTRVTRLGEFSPVGRLITLVIFVKMTEIAQIIGLHFSTVKVAYWFSQKNGFIVGYFFTNASGHPDNYLRGRQETRTSFCRIWTKFQIYHFWRHKIEILTTTPECLKSAKILFSKSTRLLMAL
jgi:hypothetical protein